MVLSGYLLVRGIWFLVYNITMTNNVTHNHFTIPINEERLVVVSVSNDDELIQAYQNLFLGAITPHRECFFACYRRTLDLGPSYIQRFASLERAARLGSALRVLCIYPKEATQEGQLPIERFHVVTTCCSAYSNNPLENNGASESEKENATMLEAEAELEFFLQLTMNHPVALSSRPNHDQFVFQQTFSQSEDFEPLFGRYSTLDTFTELSEGKRVALERTVLHTCPSERLVIRAGESVPEMEAPESDSDH